MCARRLRAVAVPGRNQPTSVSTGRTGRPPRGGVRRVCGETPGRSRTRRTGRPDPGDTEPALWRRRKYLGRLDATRCVRAARRGRSTRYLGRSRTVPPDGAGTWAYKPPGEVAGDAVREVGVASGTHEPRSSKSLGTASSERRREATQKAPARGKGPRRVRRARRRSGRVGESGLMVAEAMTETLAPRGELWARIPAKAKAGAG